ncbi:MAG: hypothetical protein SchgKO_16710 [Schleiferiaceae bacterium]
MIFQSVTKTVSVDPERSTENLAEIINRKSSTLVATVEGPDVYVAKKGAIESFLSGSNSNTLRNFFVSPLEIRAHALRNENNRGELSFSIGPHSDIFPLLVLMLLALIGFGVVLIIDQSYAAGAITTAVGLLFTAITQWWYQRKLKAFLRIWDRYMKDGI